MRLGTIVIVFIIISIVRIIVIVIIMLIVIVTITVALLIFIAPLYIVVSLSPEYIKSCNPLTTYHYHLMIVTDLTTK